MMRTSRRMTFCSRNYFNTAAGAPETRWSEANKDAFLKAVRDGKGLVVFHHASAPSRNPTGTSLKKQIARWMADQGLPSGRHTFSTSRRPMPSTRSLMGCRQANLEHKIDESSIRTR